MEGIYIPMLKLASRGKMDETALAFIRANTRQPVETEGDVVLPRRLQRRRPASGSRRE